MRKSRKQLEDVGREFLGITLQYFHKARKDGAFKLFIMRRTGESDQRTHGFEVVVAEAWV